MMKPSKYQENIFEWVKNGDGNAIVKAVAGSGKTTTALQSAVNMKGDGIFLGFNKKIVNEIQNKLSNMGLPNFKAATFHSEGLKALTASKGRLKVENSKVYYLTKNYTDKSKELGAATSFIQKIVGLAKNSGIGINGQSSIDDTESWVNIIQHHDITLDADVSIYDVIEIAKQVLKDSNNNFLQIDFDDMIYLPLYFGVKFYQYKWIIVDEAQDTNVCRKLMLKEMLSNGRLLAIGDEAQAIYGFTGAENDSMNLIKDMFNCVELPLSVCYRCGKNIVNAAKEYLPEIEAYENSGDGIIRTEKYDDFIANSINYKLSKNDGIICRNNSPLVSLAFGLIRKGIGCRIEGRDIGKNLLQLCSKWKVNDLDTFLEKLVKFFSTEFDKANRAKLQLLEDKLDTMIILIERCQSLGLHDVNSLKKLIENMFSDSDESNISNVVVLSSIHKSKGLEFDRTFILGMNQFQPSKYATMDWMKLQEKNLTYVGLTRAKNELVHITDVPTRSKISNNKPEE